MVSRTAALPVAPIGDRTEPGGTGSADRLNQFFETACDRTPSAVALECGADRLSYAELDTRANRMAHHLRRLGIGPGRPVALMLPQSVETYVCLLGVCKADAAFVPIDSAAPPDRVSFILRDVRAAAVLTTSALAAGADWAGPRRTCPVIEVDTCARELAPLPSSRPPTEDKGPKDPLAYVMYTSGSSGRPKGVEIARSSICNFLRVVSPVYGVRPQDRVYQGMAISFDFSIEEIWPTWAAGATLVAGPAGPARLGAELADFLQERGVTVLYCVPTLLATVPHDLPRIRGLVVGGEACPCALVERWSRPGRRMLNTYGPTEATVTATWQELLPGRPVTIGRPLPTYSAVLLDERRHPVPHGDIGEICLGGPGLARGYVGRPDLTADRFVEHPLAPGAGSGLLYRTGDLGRPATTFNDLLGRLDAATRRQRRFIADAAHELRSPLSTLHTRLEVADQHPESAHWQTLAPELLRETERLNRLVDDLLRLARLDAQPRLRTRSVDLDEIVFAEVREARDRTGLVIDQHAAGAARVSGDEDALARVVRNLLDNAPRHAATRIDVSLRTLHGTARLVVADDGPGIPGADRERVFDRFTRLDDARARDTGGSGLGLAIVRDIVVAHHGSTHIEDNRPGTRLIFVLPVEARIARASR
ncbi:amino acid adenylation domain-containing protein [Streptomyces atratus]|uniref:amino acid adenylation domain-containing protein n=1 Tax=Streptomyces atratus TaxID=1893 RepID=UPI0021A4DB5B|nr:amino acid adenylation domain-containing protein [Streptomyces atratus]MCT2543054.1 amino acid adenylation domain-containing protein [Streptomyces atratus]